MLKPRVEGFGRLVCSDARGLFVTDAFVFENCSTGLVSTDREVDRAHHDPRNLAALRFAKEMYQRARARSASQWN
jgi:hypothetical protein